MVDLDLDRPDTAALRDGAHDDLWVVARRRGVPQAIVETTRERAAADLSRMVGVLGAEPLDTVPDSALPSATVVVCSIVARLEDLGRCLDQLEALAYPRVEILLVDNRTTLPEDDALPELIAAHRRVRLVRCPTPGLSAARNAGIRAASGEIVAFTDDDTLVDPTWLRAIGRRFATEPGLDAVTGLILPAELETPAQVYFERYYGGFAGVRTYARLTARAGRRLPGRARVAVRDEAGTIVRRIAIYGVGALGAGANMSFRRSTLVRLRGFDECLGLGTPAKGGEDLSILMRLLWTGGSLGYEPAAAIFHRHRVEYQELTTQMYYYGLGYAATLTSLVVRDARHLLGLGLLALPASRAFVSQALRRMRGIAGVRASGARDDEPTYPRELFMLELRGLPSGPPAYVRSRLTARRAGRSTR